MAKGAIAKAEVTKKIAAAFGASDKHEIVTETDTMSGKEALFKVTINGIYE